MNNSTILFSTIGFAILLGVSFQIIVRINRKRQQEEYPELWKQFEELMTSDSFEDQEIIQLGTKIIYNKFVRTKHLETIHEIAKKKELSNPALSKLRLNAYDKWIHHTKGQGYG